jgi:glycosyl transferase, family 25
MKFGTAAPDTMTASHPTTAIRVINLAGSADRRAAFTEMAGDTKLDWAFFPACTGLVEPLTYDARVATRRCGRPLSPAELACYASHFKIWEWLGISDYDQAIIFEDDVLVAWPVIEQIAAHRFADHGVDLLRLFITHPFAWQIAKYRLLSPHHHLVRPVGMQFGGQAYLLTRAAARRLVSNYSVAAAPLDWVLGRYWEHHLATYCMFPFPVIERHNPSTIGEGRNAVPKRGLYDRIARMAWRIRDRAERAYVECCLMQRYPLGPTADEGPPFLQPIDIATQAGSEPVVNSIAPTGEL